MLPGETVVPRLQWGPGCRPPRTTGRVVEGQGRPRRLPPTHRGATCSPQRLPWRGPPPPPFPPASGGACAERGGAGRRRRLRWPRVPGGREGAVSRRPLPLGGFCRRYLVDVEEVVAAEVSAELGARGPEGRHGGAGRSGGGRVATGTRPGAARGRGALPSPCRAPPAPCAAPAAGWDGHPVPAPRTATHPCPPQPAPRSPIAWGEERWKGFRAPGGRERGVCPLLLRAVPESPPSPALPGFPCQCFGSPPRPGFQPSQALPAFPAAAASVHHGGPARLQALGVRKGSG